MHLRATSARIQYNQQDLAQFVSEGQLTRRVAPECEKQKEIIALWEGGYLIVLCEQFLGIEQRLWKQRARLTANKHNNTHTARRRTDNNGDALLVHY